MATEMKADLLYAAGAKLGEGPVWDAPSQRLYWVDIMGHALHVFDPATGSDRCLPVGEYIGTVVPWRPGKAVVALTERFAAVDLASGAIETLAALAPSGGAVRFNDGKCDPRGRFWAGTMSLKGVKGAGTLYVLDAARRIEPRLSPVGTSNGIAWSRDARTMYFIDTPTGGVDAFDYDDETAAISNRRRVSTLAADEGHPDGMTLDEEGMLWVAHWGGARVTRRHPVTGEVLAVVRVPALRTTACWFGGPRLDTLYITSAATGLNESQMKEYPHSGGLFCVSPGTRGLPAAAFAGS